MTRLMSKSMLKGTRQRSAEKIASAIESAGGHVDTFSGNNSHGVSLDIMSEDFVAWPSDTTRLAPFPGLR